LKGGKLESLKDEHGLCYHAGKISLGYPNGRFGAYISPQGNVRGL
jgi:hypothetical protein